MAINLTIKCFWKADYIVFQSFHPTNNRYINASKQYLLSSYIILTVVKAHYFKTVYTNDDTYKLQVKQRHSSSLSIAHSTITFGGKNIVV